MQARGFPGRMKAYETKQAISVRRSGSVEQRARHRQGEKLTGEANFKEGTFAMMMLASQLKRVWLLRADPSGQEGGTEKVL